MRASRSSMAANAESNSSASAVVGIKHPEFGEEVGAAVALKPGHKTDPDELKKFVRDRLAAYKYPRAVWLVDTLPKGPTGQDPPSCRRRFCHTTADQLGARIGRCDGGRRARHHRFTDPLFVPFGDLTSPPAASRTRRRAARSPSRVLPAPMLHGRQHR